MVHRHVGAKCWTHFERSRNWKDTKWVKRYRESKFGATALWFHSGWEDSNARHALRQLRTGEYELAKGGNTACRNCGEKGAESKWTKAVSHMFFSCKAQTSRDALNKLEASLESIRTQGTATQGQKAWIARYKQITDLYTKAGMLLGGSFDKGRALVGWLEVAKDCPSIHLQVIEFLNKISA